MLHHISALDLVKHSNSSLSHDQLKLGAQNIQHLLHSRLTERRQAPEVRPPDAHRLCSDSQRLEDVSASSEAAVDQNWYLPLHGVNHFWKAFHRSASTLFSAASMVGHDQSVNSILHAQRSVFASHDAF